MSVLFNREKSWCPRRFERWLAWGIFCGAMAWLPSAGGAAEVPNEPVVQGTEAPKLRIHPSLVSSRESITSSNMAVHLHGPPVTDGAMQEYSVRLRAAGQMISRKDLKGAEDLYVSLVLSPADEEIKKTALLELALIAREQGELARAQQIYSQYNSRYPRDPSKPEILLRQGLLYREMGASTLARSKFYAVLGSALVLRDGDLPYHQRLVLQAQTEIADSYYHEGSYASAREYLQRLLKLDSPDLNRRFIRYKLVHCHAAMGDHEQVVADSRTFLGLYPGADETAEVRSRLARSLKALGFNQESLAQLSHLMQEQSAFSGANQESWNYWRKKVGNEIANQLYQEEDYLRALNLYQDLAAMDDSPPWQLPVLYQAGLCYERLDQPLKAREIYDRIAGHAILLQVAAGSGLSTVIEMAGFRSGLLKWTNDFKGRVDKLTSNEGDDR